eukprot:scaffold65473_cov75-Phaeocystis_antarctica.AAC.1
MGAIPGGYGGGDGGGGDGGGAGGGAGGGGNGGGDQLLFLGHGLVLRHWDLDTDLPHDARLEVALVFGVWDANRLAARVCQAQVEHLAPQSGVRGEHIRVDSVANGAHTEVTALGAITLALAQLPPSPSPPVRGRWGCSRRARHFGGQQKTSGLGIQQAASLERQTAALWLGAPVGLLDAEGDRFFLMLLLVSLHHVLQHELIDICRGLHDLHHDSLRYDLLVIVIGHRGETVRRGQQARDDRDRLLGALS